MNVRPTQDAEQEADANTPAAEEPGDDDGNPAPMVGPARQLDVREGLRLAEAEVAKNPLMHRAFRWALRTIAGESYLDVASSEGVTEETVRSAIKALRAKLRASLPDVAALFVCIAVVFFLYAALDRRHDDAAIPAPKPVPWSVAPSPSPRRSRRRMTSGAALSRNATRQLGETACGYSTSRGDFDPAGNAAERVQLARQSAEEAIVPGDGKP